MSPKFLTKKKFLTFYSLTCGYLEVNQEYRQSDRYSISLEWDSCCFHVKVFENKTNERIVWESFESGKLKQARKFFMQKIKEF